MTDSRSTRYRQSLRARALEAFGGRCQDCGSIVNLQFAHVWPTGLKGQGRGSKRRFRDVLNNQYAYRLLCYDCHAAFDAGAPLNLPLRARM